MKIISGVAIPAVVFCGLAVQAFQHAAHTDASDKSSGGPDWSELISSMEKMHAAMASAKSSGNSDADFVRLMLPHHQAAIDMARTQLLYGKDPQLHRLAQEIITRSAIGDCVDAALGETAP